MLVCDKRYWFDITVLISEYTVVAIAITFFSKRKIIHDFSTVSEKNIV